MIKMNFTPEELIGRWEDQRDIKNLMGRYVLDVLLQREGELFDLYWCKKSQNPVLGTQKGYYNGAAAIRDYYSSIVQIDKFNAERLCEMFPERFGESAPEDLFGIGNYDMLPVDTPVIEIASDGKTAKGIWHSAGSKICVGTSGPVQYWSMGYFCGDFVREDDQWKIWHLVFAEEYGFPGGQSWAVPETSYPEIGAFSVFSQCPKVAEPSIKSEIWPRYSQRRAFVGTPLIPKPYDTFSETFSYVQTERVPRI